MTSCFVEKKRVFTLFDQRSALHKLIYKKREHFIEKIEETSFLRIAWKITSYQVSPFAAR